MNKRGDGESGHGASRSVKVAVVAGSNLAGFISIFAVWLLQQRGLIAPTPLWVLIPLILAATPSDLATRAWLRRAPHSQCRIQTRVAASVLVTTAVIYAAGWGSLLTIAYALCVVQLLAQINDLDWRVAYAWCLACVAGAEVFVTLGWSPSMISSSLAHATAAIGLAGLAPILWIVSGAFAVRDAAERETRAREQVLAKQVGIDSLTGVPNRSALHAALEDPSRETDRLILAFVDLNDFKDINDSFGHHVGDEVLIEVANRLQQVVRGDDIVARLGGDEFVILIRNPPDAFDTTSLVGRVRAILNEPFAPIAPHVLRASVGVVEDADGSVTADELLKSADAAMYARKHGTSSSDSLQVMTSRALAHHRNAMDGFTDTFCVLRAVGRRDHTEWQLIEANRNMREYYEQDFGDPLGALWSVLPTPPEMQSLQDVFADAVATKQRREVEFEITPRSGNRMRANFAVVPVDSDVIALMVRDVTEHHRLLKELEEERTRFATLVTDSSSLAYIVDETGRTLYRPPGARPFLDLPDADTSPLSLVVENDRSVVSEWFARVVASPDNEVPAVNVHVLTRDGSVHVCEIAATNRLGDPVIHGIVVNIHDVSAVVEAEARLAAVTENIQDIIAIIDAEGTVTWASAAVESVLGLTPAAVAGTSAFDLIHPEDRELTAVRLFEVLSDADTESAPIELRLLDTAGVPHWFECTGVNKLDDPALRGVVVSLHNITERRASEAAVRVAEQRSSAIVEAVTEAIITVDANGVVRRFNRAAELMFGTSREEAVGGSYTRFLPSESSDLLREALREGLIERPMDATCTRSSGETFDARVTISQFELAGEVMFTAVVQDVTQQRRLENALRNAALHDELTGLPNRRLVVARTSAAIENGRSGAGHLGLMFIDLDHFKFVNDGLGHDVGDEVLIEVSARVAAQIRHDDMVARTGGDDFVVVCEDVDSIETITAIAERIRTSLEYPIRVHCGEIFVTASIGVAIWQPPDTPLDLLRHAETAMYRAKHRGRGQMEYFDTTMGDEVSSRLGIESALRQAIEADQFRAYYQPIVDLESHEISYFEALVRWDRPGFGIVMPNSFIPAAEAAGLVVGIGNWMLAQAAADCAAWQRVAPGVGVSINVSVKQFEIGDLVSAVSGALRAAELDPALMTIEITESVMLQHTDRNAATLTALRDMGIHIALDDFGTGYSSLTYLRRLPIDSLKIDRSFLQSLETDERDVAMIQAIVDLGKTYDVDVVAEGIDTEAKLRAVRSLGCRFGQGFLFSRPAPIEDIAMHLAVDRAFME